jgi:hypothetical protein
MKRIDINYINKYPKFITRTGQTVKFLNYIPEANERNRLLFFVDGNILGCNEEGKCFTINSYDYTELDTNYRNFDVFVADKMDGWVHLYEKNDFFVCDDTIFRTYEDAKSVADKSNVKVDKIAKIEWSIIDDN